MQQNLRSLDESILLKIYDTVRYVNPIEKNCILSSAGVEGGSSFLPHCFSVWDRNAVCENCISMRALSENKVVMKLEYSYKKIYMVTAVPMDDHEPAGRVIELIRDVTNENLLDSEDLLNEEIVLEKINKLNREIISDPLTQLYNRRFMDERLPYEIAQSWTTKAPMSLIMADIDFFKKINDTYGHLVGDQILSGFSNLLKSMVRENHDWVIRYGGEEFLLFFADSDREDILKKAEQIRDKVENHIFCIDDFKIKITSSFGVYSTVPEQVDGMTLAKIYIDRADKALYHSKKTGRNKVCCYNDLV